MSDNNQIENQQEENKNDEPDSNPYGLNGSENQIEEEESKSSEISNQKSPETYTRDQVEEVVRQVSSNTANKIIKRERQRHQAEMDKIKSQVREEIENKEGEMTNQSFDKRFDELMEDPDFQEKFYGAVDQAIDKRERSRLQNQENQRIQKEASKQIEDLKKEIDNYNLNDKNNPAPDVEKTLLKLKGTEFTEIVNSSIEMFDNGIAFLYNVEKNNPSELRRIAALPNARQQIAELVKLERKTRAGKKQSTGAPRPLSQDFGGAKVGGSVNTPSDSIDFYNHPVFQKLKRR